MKTLLFFFFAFLLQSVFAKSQNINLNCDSLSLNNVLFELSVLKSKLDSVNIAYSYFKCKEVENERNKLIHEIEIIEGNQSYLKYKNKVQIYASLGMSAVEQKSFDSAKSYFLFIEKSSYSYLVLDSMQFKIIYEKMADIYIGENLLDSSYYFLSKALYYKSTNMILMIDFLSNANIDFQKELFVIDMYNTNILKFEKHDCVSLTLLLNMIFINDQIVRKKDIKNEISIEDKRMTDSLNQFLFSYLLDRNILFYQSSEYLINPALSQVLLNSIVGNIEFFEKYFSLYCNLLNDKWDMINNEFVAPKHLFDVYLKQTRGTQFFGQAFGLLENGRMELLPKENIDTVKSVLNTLNINPDLFIH